MFAAEDRLPRLLRILRKRDAPASRCVAFSRAGRAADPSTLAFKVHVYFTRSYILAQKVLH
jgi:hypothetical protein